MLPEKKNHCKEKKNHKMKDCKKRDQNVIEKVFYSCFF